MSKLGDCEYFADRADQENEVGDRAASPLIAAIHYELAYRYALLCGDGARNVVPLILKRA